VNARCTAQIAALINRSGRHGQTRNCKVRTLLELDKEVYNILLLLREWKIKIERLLCNRGEILLRRETEVNENQWELG
jgi:hypothetical protein